MKTVSFAEFDELIEGACAHLGAYIDGIVLDNDILQIQLRRPPKNVSLLIDVRGRVPFFIITDRPLPRLKKQTKPIVLFLRAHAMGLPLVSVSRQKKYGRLVEFVFGSGERQLTLEAHLFPQGKNIKVATAESSICLKKPQELTEVSDSHTPVDKRTIDELYRDWMAQFEKTGSAKKVESPQTALVAKKEASLRKLKEHIKTLEESPWPEFAQWLNQERTEDVPKKYTQMMDTGKSVVENIERAFAEAKKVKAKIAGAQERLAVLEKELGRIATGDGQVTHGALKAPEKSPLLGAKGRTREFEGNIRAYIGKSGTDNLKLLRQSKPWYIWVHAKDWPSAHAIIAVNKGAALPPAVLRDVCLWVLRETVSDKQWQSWLGIKVDFLYTERRYLQPIKGDHHGRVRYTEAKTLTLVVE